MTGIVIKRGNLGTETHMEDDNMKRQMNLEGIILSQIYIDKCFMISLIWNLKNNQIKNKLIETENRLMAARGQGFRGPGEKGERINKYKLVVA